MPLRNEIEIEGWSAVAAETAKRWAANDGKNENVSNDRTLRTTRTFV